MLSARFYDNGRLRGVAGGHFDPDDVVNHPGEGHAEGDSDNFGAGQDIFDTERNFLGRLAFTTDGTHRPYLYDPARGPGFVVMPPFNGGTFLNAIGKAISLSTGGITVLGSVPTGPSSSGAAVPFGSTKAGIQFSADIAAKAQDDQQAFLAQQAVEAEKAAKSRALISGAANLAAQRSSQIQQARTLLADTLGKDTVRGIALAQGGLGFGTTPNQAFRGQLRGFADTPTVNFDANANLATQQGQFDALTAQVANTGPVQGNVGFKHGGTISVDKKVEQAILVGEPREDGQPNPEVVMIKGGRMTVIPLTGQAAHGGSFSSTQFGGNFGAGFEPTQRQRQVPGAFPGNKFGEGSSPSAIAGALAPVFQSLGFTGTVPFGVRQRGDDSLLRPLSLRNAGGQLSNMGLSFAGLNALGIQPKLFRLGTAVFLRDADGTLRRFRDMEQFDAQEFNRSEIVQVAPTGTELAHLRAESANAPLVTDQRGISGPNNANTRPSAVSGQAIFSPTTGLLLPDPAQIAALFRPGVLDPDTLALLGDVFNDAGISDDAIQADVNAFTPRGTATGAQVGFG